MSESFEYLVFLVFGLSTEIYTALPRIQSEYGKMRTRGNSLFR